MQKYLQHRSVTEIHMLEMGKPYNIIPSNYGILDNLVLDKKVHVIANIYE